MGKRVLLVEGKNDQHVMWNLFDVRQIAEVFEVECPESLRDPDQSGGIDKLLDAVPRRLLDSDLERLAIVMDANNKGPKARWDAIRSRLLNEGYKEVPKNMPEEGVVELSLRPRTPRSVRLAVWVMPDNQSQGMIEDFVAQMIRDDDDVLPLVDDFLASIPEDQQRFSPNHQSKARIHSWLAIQERPGRPMGQAIGAKKHLDPDRPAVDSFLQWINHALITDGQSP